MYLMNNRSRVIIIHILYGLVAAQGMKAADGVTISHMP